MKRVVVMFLVLASAILCSVGSVSAAHGGGIDPFSISSAKVRP